MVSARSCQRRFEVEAARDGRITGAARASIETHLSTCEVCAAEARSLGGIARALAALPVAGTDALSVRRQRQRILARLNEAQVTQRGEAASRPPWRRAAGVSVVAAALAAWAVVAASRDRSVAPTSGSAKAADPADDVVVVVPETALWSRAEQGPNTRVKLDDGELDIVVKHRGEAHGLVVALPDGELQDVGTTFRVRVRAGRTVAIVVREGAVVFRKLGAGPMLLGAGESWTADDLSVATAPSAAVSSGSTIPAPSQPPHRSMSLVSKAEADAAKEFRGAVDLLNGGNAAAAVSAFRAYLARRPPPERAEDATYLLVLALHRAGDEPEAQAAARNYLRLYPDGLRHREVESLAGFDH
jgi:hypothetical protein